MRFRRWAGALWPIITGITITGLIGGCTAEKTVSLEPVEAKFFFYGLDGDTIPVSPMDSILVVSFKPGVIITPTQFAKKVVGIADDYPFWQWTDGFWVMGIDAESALGDVFLRVKARSEVGTVNPVLAVSPDMVGWMTDALIVRFHSRLSSAQIDSFNATQGVAVGYKIVDVVNEYVLAIPHDRGLDVLGVCRTYYESGLCVYAQPNVLYQYVGQPRHPHSP